MCCERKERMIFLDLTSEEQETLVEVLECALADFHLEILGTEGKEFGRLMHYRAEVIRKVIAAGRGPH
jgi:hypothetical protein